MSDRYKYRNLNSAPSHYVNENQPKGSILLEETLDLFLQDKGKGDDNDGGTYRRNIKREINRFIEWAEGKRGSENWSGVSPNKDSHLNFDDLYPKVVVEYIRFLSSKETLQPSSVITYYNYISSWVEWCKAEKIINDNYIITTQSRIPLPNDSGLRSDEKQFWSRTNLENLLSHCDEIADKKIKKFCKEHGEIEDQTVLSKDAERDWYDVVTVLRDRSLMYVLGYSAVRGSEILRLSDDPRREGIFWDDIYFETKEMRVFRKNQSWSLTPIPDDALDTLKQYRKWLNYPPKEWPVFPSLHYPTISSAVKDYLKRQNYNTSTIKRSRDEFVYDFSLALMEEIPIPSLTTDGCRRLLKQLSNDADIEVGVNDHLVLHGARRGIAELIIREYDFATAARYLDNSEEILRKNYSHIEAEKLNKIVEKAIEKEQKDSDIS